MTSSAEPTAGGPVRVFISYAHDSDEHVAAVRDLWIFLRSQGIDARLDLPAAERRQEWPTWMTEQLRDARFVLVVASPAYKLRSDGPAAADEGRGVQFEAGLIREYFYRDRRAGVQRFLPVLLPRVSAACIPDFLSPVSATSYRVSSMSVAGCEKLLRVLTGQPYEVEPPLGRVPVLAPRVATQPSAVPDEKPDEPSVAPPSASDLDALSDEQIQLLRRSVKALQETMDASADLAHTTPLSVDVDEASARMQRSLDRAQQQLLALQSGVSLIWPDADWAMKFNAARDRAQRNIVTLRGQPNRRTASGRLAASKQDKQIRRSVDKLLFLLKDRYPSLFTG